MALDPDRPRGLEALLGVPRSSKRAAESDQLYDFATLACVTEFTEVEQVKAAVEAREILAVDHEGTQKFPALQFKDGKFRAGIGEVLRAAPRSPMSRIFQFLRQPNDMMLGRRPIDLIGEAESTLRLVVLEAQKLDSDSDAGRPG